MLNLDQEDVDPRMEQVVQTLGAKLEGYRGVFLSDRIIRQIDEMLKDHRNTWKMRGVDCPKMVAVVLAKCGVVEILREDLEFKALQSAVVGIVKKYPGVEKEELARAMFRVFPHYANALVSQKALN